MSAGTLMHGDKFEFTPENEEIAKWHIAKYPEGKQQSAVMPLLDLAQRQNDGHVTVEIMEYLADYLGMPAIRVQEVATFYTMYNHKKIGKHHVRVCGTTPCWLRGSDDIMKACKDKLGIEKGQTTEDGLFTLDEIECAGACVNAPVLSIGDDYYEDLTPESVVELLNKLAAGDDPKPGPQVDRLNSAPAGDKTSLFGSEE
ncbi:NADH-quinone oxidoreductase subunit NuoE [Temperatibacter marinus]|uniref:NADH-quinone oxidoreductase subunit NuoE n=1 Tax=Temperatibacter marinus TaxID=1456591 RepID=A0AA52EH39_9PROT|nr:NADH-quinone oxidoreductase subunit NuoE [Temperatibacter marinus]WND02412.1 NADH-quinone oxidoreductase subunit NuoE [Temperatibacter marinus]